MFLLFLKDKKKKKKTSITVWIIIVLNGPRQYTPGNLDGDFFSCHIFQ